MTKTREEIVEVLEKYLERIKDQSNYLYKKRLEQTINHLKYDNSYQDQLLIVDLEVLGFGELARKVRMEQYA